MKQNVRLVQVLFLLAIVTIFFLVKYNEIFFGGQILGPFKDNTYLVGPLFGYLDSVFDKGNTPLWIDGMYYGMPIFDSPMISLNYPFLFTILDFGDPIQSIRTLDFLYIFHFLFYCVSTFFLLRHTGFSYWASLISSLLSINFLVFAKFMSWGLNIIALSWLPAAILAIVLIHESKRSKLGICLFAISAIGFTAKPSQPLIQVVIICGALILSSIISKKFNARLLVNYFMAGALALAVSGQGFILAFLNINDKLRWVAKGVTKVGPEKIEFEHFAPYFSLSQISDTLFQKGFGTGGPGSIYIGPVACFLLIFGIGIFLWHRASSKNWLLLPMILLSVYFFISTFSEPINLTKVNAYIPLLNKIRQPVRHSFIFVLCIPMLAAFAFDALHKSKNRSILIWLFSLFCIMVFGLHSNTSFILTSNILKVVMILLFAVLTFCATHFRKPLALGLLLISFIGYECILQPPGSIVKKSQWSHNQEENLNAHSTLKDLSPLIDLDFDRVIFDDDQLADSYWAMNGLFYGIRSFYGNFAPVPVGQFRQFQNKDNQKHYRYLTGGRYEIHSRSNQDTKGNKIIYENEHHQVIEHASANQWAYFADHLVEVKHEKQIMSAIRKHDPKNLLVLPAQTILDHELDKSMLPSHAKRKLTFERLNHNKFSIQYEVDESSVIVINELFSPNWRMNVNNEPRSFIKANINQIAILVESGIGEIELTYAPRGYKILGIIRMLGFLVIIGIGLFSFYNNKVTKPNFS